MRSASAHCIASAWNAATVSSKYGCVHVGFSNTPSSVRYSTATIRPMSSPLSHSVDCAPRTLLVDPSAANVSAALVARQPHDSGREQPATRGTGHQPRTRRLRNEPDPGLVGHNELRPPLTAQS